MVPQFVHLGKSQVFEVLALLFSAFLKPVESCYKFAVGTLESVDRVYIIKTGRIYEAEEKIAEFRFDIFAFA